MSEAVATTPLSPDAGLARSVREEFGPDVNRCYQCGRCAAGCPVAFAMDHPPAQLIHAIRLGLEEIVLNSKTMWLCASCETCTTRCPQDVDIAKVMDAVKILAVRRGYRPAVRSVRAFHEAAISNIRLYGRMWEAGMILSLKRRTGHYTKDIELGRTMFRKGKLRLLPTFTGSARIRRVFSRVRKIEREEARRP